MTRHFFLVNPAAGQGKALDLIPDIHAVCQVAGIDYEVHETTAPGDAERFVRSCCEKQAAVDGATASADRQAARATASADRQAASSLRFYACGGDGTLNEVVNGAAGYDFAEIGCIPAGTGNDFIRNFPEGRFDDLIAQIRGQASLCDLIRYEGICDDAYVSRYCVNMFNIGFDSNVVDLTARMKKLPLMSGSLAYLASVFAMLAEKKGADLRVEYGDGFVHDGKLLLIAVANGCFCGGGVKGIPRAVTDDGRFDVSLVRNIPRHTFVRLFPKYMKGTHLSDRRLSDVIRYTRETSLHISPNRKTMKLCVDGEITKAGAVRFTIAPKAFRFVVPGSK
ncbi:MAG: diacylglycerol kinase family lipid kinase [Firmicutes bacterium]|nr:diacylglycerol kinase family lipid kinase [Bacillota bacterium]